MEINELQQIDSLLLYLLFIFNCLAHNTIYNCNTVKIIFGNMMSRSYKATFTTHWCHAYRHRSKAYVYSGLQIDLTKSGWKFLCAGVSICKKKVSTRINLCYRKILARIRIHPHTPTPTHTHTHTYTYTHTHTHKHKVREKTIAINRLKVDYISGKTINVQNFRYLSLLFSLARQSFNIMSECWFALLNVVLHSFLLLCYIV